jgi:hypothetical protein
MAPDEVVHDSRQSRGMCLHLTCIGEHSRSCRDLNRTIFIAVLLVVVGDMETA